jgi:hypothetical protein
MLCDFRLASAQSTPFGWTFPSRLLTSGIIKLASTFLGPLLEYK